MNSAISICRTTRILTFLWALVWLITALPAAAASTRRIQAVEERLESCDPQVALAAADEFVHNSENLKEPLNLFMPAKVLFDHGRKDDAVFWFYAAQLRTRYQVVFEKGDRPQLLSVMLMTIGTSINNYAFQDVDRFDRTLDRVLAWDKATPNPYSDRLNVQTAKQVEQIYTGFRDFRVKLAANKQDNEQQARMAAPGILNAYTQASAASRCAEGKRRGHTREETEAEWESVVGFAKANSEVIRATGTIVRVSRGSLKTKSGEHRPYRYSVVVAGERQKTIAIIDVSRSSDDVQLRLACVKPLAAGQLDSRKDDCAQ
jgi:hypothetical protein